MTAALRRRCGCLCCLPIHLLLLLQQCLHLLADEAL